MSDTPAEPAVQPANLMTLRDELARLAISSKPANRPPHEQGREGTVIVMRGK
jgi:hypothetical protein